jgi:hypothetical protein
VKISFFCLEFFVSRFCRQIQSHFLSSSAPTRSHAPDSFPALSFCSCSRIHSPVFGARLVFPPRQEQLHRPAPVSRFKVFPARLDCRRLLHFLVSAGFLAFASCRQQVALLGLRRAQVPSLSLRVPGTHFAQW